jgi:DNA-binding response OmpR family regulator
MAQLMAGPLAKTSARPAVLVVEDDPDIAELVQFNLDRAGFSVAVARDGERGLAEIRVRRPDLVVLDLMLPGIDGLEVCRQLRADERTRSIPIVMLTAKTEESDVVLGLGLGADDYLGKPFSPRELVARVRSVLRRAARKDEAEEPTRIERGAVVIDAGRHEVLVRGEPVELTRAEFRLLWALLSRPGRVLTRSQLVDRITAGECIILERNVDVHMSSLRRKLGSAGDELLVTIRGVGYKCRD